MSQETQLLYEFGPFRFLPDEKLLLRQGQPVPLPPKAVDTLAVLLERQGHVVLKDDLMRRVWPDTFVEEGNLTQQISLLRKAFTDVGDEPVLIETIPRRGYRLLAKVTRRTGDDLLVMHERTRTHVVVEEPAAAMPVTSTATRSRVWRSTAVVILVLALGGAGAFYWFRASRPALPFEQRDWVLILDFENATGDARFDRALASAFGVGLEQSRYFNVYSRARVADALRRMGKPPETLMSEEIATEVARRDGIRALVACSVARIGDQFALTARLIDPQRLSAVNAYTVRASGEDDLLDALDTLSRRVRRGLGESRLSISQASKPLPQVTTSSFAALQVFVEGTRAWNSGRLNEGIANWERAVALDPGFALAHAELGAALASHIRNDEVESEKHFETALALTERTTERERRVIEARHLTARGHLNDLLPIYDLYLKSYPDDPAVHFNRGLTLMRLQRCNEAVADFEEVLRISPTNAAALIDIATCHHVRGQHRIAIAFYERAFALEPSWLSVANLNHEYGFALVGAGELVKAADVFTKALLRPDTASALRSLALLDLYQGKYRDAEVKLREAQQASPGDALRRARNRLFLAIVREGQGRRVEQIAELDRAAADLAEQPLNGVFALRTAAAYARAGAVEKAARLTHAAQAEADEKDSDLWSELHRALGEIALARGDQAEALDEFRTADRAKSSPMTLESLAFAFRVAGRAADAVEAYEKLLSSGGWLGWEPQQPWLEAHVRLAALTAARGEAAKAISLLDGFLSRWPDADADLPLVIEARLLRQSLRPAR